ncbi:MAG: hypothetical protein IAI50_02425 [Candidatus Eremiobacteraeota bacterium]|nr:hypothetical protein [Candidatus Eremiobacteraeota bacterium]
MQSAALARQRATIAVSDIKRNVVHIYDPAGDELAQLTGFRQPAGLASDIKGDLYVADNGNHRVQIYAAGFRTRPTTLSDPGYDPLGVDSYNDGQIVAVANSLATNFGPGNVKFFTNGQLTNTVSSPVIPYFSSCAFDAAGNLYVQGNGIDHHARVGEIIGGAHGHKVTLLTTSNGLGYSSNLSGIQVTTAGQIAVGAYAGPGSHKTVYTYDPPVGESLGSPVFATALLGTEPGALFAFAKNMTSLYTADFSGESQQYAYPAGGNALSTIDVSGQPYGIAVIPTQYPKVQK